MNDFQNTLYLNLMNLTKQSDSFYYKDHVLNDIVYRIFNYRICSYSDFLFPDAQQCRGIMFEVSDSIVEATPIRLASLPMEKFFNLNENPITMDLDFSNIEEITEKRDGSLISTYMHNGKMRLKTKGSLNSEQAIDAMRHLNKLVFLKEEIIKFVANDHTVNLEYTSPENRVVIGYQEPELFILNVRNNKTGEYCNLGRFSNFPFEIFDHALKKLNPDSIPELINSIPSMTGIEGYVALFKNGLRVKMKTEWYLTQHRVKNSISSPRRLFEAVIEETTDDLRSMFFDDQWVLDKISAMELFVKKLLHEVVSSVDNFYLAKKHLDRKDYAITAQNTIDKRFFGLAMSKYIGRPLDYKKFLKKEYKQFGITDEEEARNDIH